MFLLNVTIEMYFSDKLIQKVMTGNMKKIKFWKIVGDTPLLDVLGKIRHLC